MTTGPADDQPRDWETLRSDAIVAALSVRDRASRAEATAIVDAVLSVIDEETTRALCAEHIANTNLRSMEFRNGATMELQPARELVALWVGAARALLDGAENYSETTMTFGIPEDRPNRYSFVVQRVGKLTPHEARRLAEKDRDELRAAVAASLRRAAAGRREYARTAAKDADEQDRMEADARAFESAAMIAEDPLAVLDLIPSHWWTAEEQAAVLPPAALAVPGGEANPGAGKP